MHRCCVEPAAWGGDTVTLSQEEAHHLAHVVRAQPGDTVILFDGAGREALARIPGEPDGEGRRRAGKRCAVHEIAALSVVPGSETVRVRNRNLVLVQAVLKGPRMDLLVEKATELGAAAIVPVRTQHVAARERVGDDRLDRWLRIARGAAKQCGTVWLPELTPARSFSEAVALLRTCDAFFFGDLSGDALPLATALTSVRLGETPRLAVFVGPEGDFTNDEAHAMREAGGIPASFGDLTLRAETAAIYALSVMSAALDSAAARP